MTIRTRLTDSQPGQIVIMTAGILVVLIGIAALVVDIGFSWMLSRQEQNAADPAAIAAARHLKDSLGQPTWNQMSGEADACFYAQENGFFEGDPGCSNAISTGDLQVHAPPTSGDYAARTGYVQVIITARHPSFFGRIFGRAETIVRSEAVAANTAGDSNSSSLVALQSECSGGSAGDVDGGGEVRIFPTTPGAVGGYVHVNSPCGSSTDDVCQNGAGAASLSISGVLTTPYAYVTGTCTFNGSGPNGLQCQPATATACLDEDAVPLGDPLQNMPEPRLGDFPNGICPDGNPSLASDTAACEIKRGELNCVADPVDPAIDICTIQPGVYFGGWSVGSKVKLHLRPGMYILAGGGISLNGTSASIEAVTSPTVAEARIMIFSTDGPGCPSIPAQCQGEIRFQASQAFKAKALNAATCGLVSPNACPWKGILLWQDGTASNPDAVVHLGGQSSTILAGTIYAPKAQVEVSGGSATTGCGSGPTAGCLAIQIISWRWKVTGGGLVEMPYDPAELYQLDQRGLVD